jgi:hypothetical protein
MFSVFFTLLVIILFITTILLSNQKEFRFLPFWYVFILYFFKPFFSRIIAYNDSLNSFIIFDLFSTVCAMLIPMTIIYYFFFFHRTISFNFNKSNIYKYFIIFSLFYFLQMLNPGTNLGQSFLAIKNIIFIIFSFLMANLMLSIGYPYRKVLNGLIIIALLYVSYGVFQAYFGFLPFDLADYKLRVGSITAIQRTLLGDQVRPFSFALTNGHFFYSIIIIMLFLLPQLRIMTQKQRILMYLFCFLTFLLFAKAPERTPIAMFGIGLISMYFIISNATKPFKVFIFSYAIIGLFISLRVLVLPVLQNGGVGIGLYRVFELFDILNAGTFVTRFGEGGNWDIALSQIFQSPIIGYGTGTGTFTRISSDFTYSTHNDFLTIALELGFIGLFFFFFMIYKIYSKLNIVSHANDYRKCIAGGIGAALAAQLACSMFNIALLSGESSRLIWFLLGILPVLVSGQLNIDSRETKFQNN